MPAWNKPIEVTHADLAEAVPRDSGRCAVETAIARTKPWARYILVDIHTIRFSHPENGNRYIYMTPQKVRRYIVDFDAGEKLEPFAFRLGNPIQTLPYGRGATARKKSKGLTLQRFAGGTLAGQTAGKPLPIAEKRYRSFGSRSLRINQRVAAEMERLRALASKSGN